MHYFEQLFHTEEGWLSATSENMVLHVDMTAKKIAPFPTEFIAAAREDEGGARPPAAARGGGAPHRHAGQELDGAAQ